MDEAYHDFVPVSADYISFLQTPVDDERVIVARTFSKIYGMAGLRLGYAVTSARNVQGDGGAQAGGQHQHPGLALPA